MLLEYVGNKVGLAGKSKRTRLFGPGSKFGKSRALLQIILSHTNGRFVFPFFFSRLLSTRIPEAFNNQTLRIFRYHSRSSIPEKPQSKENDKTRLIATRISRWRYTGEEGAAPTQVKTPQGSVVKINCSDQTVRCLLSERSCDRRGF